MFRTRWRKTLLVIGGSGEFGQAVTKRFATPLFKRWNVFNIDVKANPQATYNFVIDLQKENPFDEDVIKKLHEEMKEFSDDYDAMVNLASVGQPPL